MGAIMGTLTAWEVPSANFVPYKVIDRDGQGTLFSLLRAIYKTLSDGADVVNMSLGFYPDPQDFETVDLVEKAILSLAENDIITVLAAGNSSKSLDEISFFPATIQSSRNIVVAASECLDSLAKFSNYGAGTVHLAAPGTDILCPTLNSKWVLASGSSYSAAITTGFTAALFSLSDNPSTDVIHCSVVNGVTPSDYLSNSTISGGVLSAEAILGLLNSGNCLPVLPPPYPQEQQFNQPLSDLVYPNPTRGVSILRLEASQQKAVQFSLFDLYGRRLQYFERALSTGINEIQLDLYDLSPGIYYLSSDGQHNIRIVKQ
jgi:subtilisin family serine protease